LADANLFPQFLDFMAANRALAASLVLQFTHSAVRAMGTVEHDSLAALSQHGFRFSMNHVMGLRLDPGELASSGFRYIKIHADLLLNTARLAPVDIHPSDLSDLLGRFGIDLIADRIEHERSVVDLLDYDVRYGQGSLFSPPRPVRAEALQALPDVPDAVTGERSPAADQLTAMKALAQNVKPSLPEQDGAEPGTVAQISRGVPGRD
jgi:cyclic-di-GMP phosphodiesterase, flagellum assembly factor TipF